MAIRRVMASGKDLLQQVITTAYIYPLPNEGQTQVRAIPVKTLWDTGATHCLITPETAKRLGLKSLGRKENNTASGKDEKDVYELGLVINEQMHFPHIYAIESYGGDRFDFAIGMSILRHGRFSLTGSGDERRMEFVIED